MGQGQFGSFSFMDSNGNFNYADGIYDEITMKTLWEMTVTKGQSLLVICNHGIRAIVGE